jgi:DNA-binding CsgD family transcriptional regulator
VKGAEGMDAVARLLAQSQALLVALRAGDDGVDGIDPWAGVRAVVPPPRPSDGPVVPPHGSLTPRMRDVLRLLAQGLSNKEIARALALEPGTVRCHVGAILRVLNARNRTEAAVMYERGRVETSRAPR